MGTSVRFTVTQGLHFLRMAHAVRFPEKLGEDKKFSAAVRATFDGEIRQLYKALRKVSPIAQKEKKLFFGPAEWWERKEAAPLKSEVREEFVLQTGNEPDRVRFILKDEYKSAEIDVELNGQAKQGLFRLLVLNLHPESQWCLAGGQQEELAWPAAEQLRCVRALEEVTGLAKGETVAIKWDDEYEAEAEAKAKKTYLEKELNESKS